MEASHFLHFSSVQFSRSVVSDSATPWAAACQTFLSITNSQSLLKPMSIKSVMPSNHPTSVVPFSSCLQSFPAPQSFLMSQLFPSGGQSIGASASASVLPMNIQDWFPLGLTGLFLIEGKLLYNIDFISAIDQHELAIGVHRSLPSWTSLLPPTLSYPFRLLQSPGLSSPSHTANSHRLSILHMVLYMLLCYSLHSFPGRGCCCRC